MKIRQDKPGKGKFSGRVEGAPAASWRHFGLWLGCAVLSAAPAVAARAPFLDGPDAFRDMSPELAAPLHPGLVTGPVIARVLAHASGAIRIDGRGTPYAAIFVDIDGVIAGPIAAGSDGRWQLRTAIQSRAGEIGIETYAHSAGTLWPVPGQAVRVTMPAVSLAANEQAQPSRIYEYARIGLLANAPETIVTRVRVAGDVWSVVNPSLRNGAVKPFNLAQAETAPAAAPAAQVQTEPAAARANTCGRRNRATRQAGSTENTNGR